MCSMGVPMPLSKRGKCWPGMCQTVLHDAAGRVSTYINLLNIKITFKGNSNAKIAAEAAMQRDMRLKITIPSEVNL